MMTQRFCRMFMIALCGLFFFSFMAVGQNVSVSGTVYENSQSKTIFKVPEGTIRCYLPDDMRSGDRISGMVIAEPDGNSAKERQKNSARMRRYRLNFSDGSKFTMHEADSASVVVQNFSGMDVPDDERFGIALMDDAGNRIAEEKLWLMPVLAGLAGPASVRLARKVIDHSEPVVLLGSTGYEADKGIFITPYISPENPDLFSDPVYLDIITASPGKRVYDMPEGMTGLYNLFVENGDGEAEFIDLISVGMIQASINKANLRRNETAVLEVAVFGLADAPYEPVRLQLDNQTPGIIRFPEGVRRDIDPGDAGTRVETADGAGWVIEQEVIGVVPGNFIIDATLVAPPASFENGIQPFIESIHADEEIFNSAVVALKEDIDHFIRSGIDDDLSGYLSDVKDHLVPADTFQSLDEAAAYTINLFNPLVSKSQGSLFFQRLNALGNILPGISKHATQVQPAHPVNNYAGRFIEDDQLLLVNPECRIELLDYLQAVKDENGSYTIQIFNGENYENFPGVSLKEVHTGRAVLPGQKAEIEPPTGRVGALPGKKKTDLKPPTGRKVPDAPGSQAEARRRASGRSGQDSLSSQADHLGRTSGRSGVKSPGGESQKAGSALGKAVAKGAAEAGRQNIDTEENPGTVADALAKKESGNDKAVEDQEAKSEKTPLPPAASVTKATWFKDDKGREYLFYKDAECHALSKDSESSCSEEYTYVGNKRDKPTGNYMKWVWKGVNGCRKGEGFCTQMKQITSIKYVYDDKNCDRLTAIETYERYSCPLP